jgi:acyl-CoA reductase-like NAD-dependent aldehyde dehydrogenase
MKITTVNPATGRILSTYDGHDDQQIERLVQRAHGAAETWGRQPLPRRLEVVTELAAVLRSRKAELAELATSEMGKLTRRQSEGRLTAVDREGEEDVSDATLDG